MTEKHHSLVTGHESGKSIKVIFTPEAPTIKVTGVVASEALGHTAHIAMLLESVQADLGAAIDRIRGLEAAAEAFEASRGKVEAGLSAIFVEEVPAVEESVPEVATGESEPDADATVLVTEDEDVALAPDELRPAFEKSSAGELEAAPPPSEDNVQPADPPAGAEVRPSRAERHLRSRRLQTEIIREIFTHPNFTHSGRLEGHNISAVIRGLVQARTEMSDKDWANTYSALRQKDFISLCTYEHRPKMAHTIVLDLELIAASMRRGELFTGEEDETIKVDFLKLADAKAAQKSSADGGSAKPASSPAGTHSKGTGPRVLDRPAPSPSSPAPIPPSRRTARSTATPHHKARPAGAASVRPAAAPPMSARVRKEFELSRGRSQQPPARATQQRSPVMGRSSFSETVLGSEEVMLPKYTEITAREWELMAGDDELRFLVALTSDRVKVGGFQSATELLNEVVSVGRINLNDGRGQHDNTKLSSIIKELKKGSQPKIEFTNKDGTLKLILTNEGAAFLATQFRKIRQAATKPQQTPGAVRTPSRAA